MSHTHSSLQFFRTASEMPPPTVIPIADSFSNYTNQIRTKDAMSLESDNAVPAIGGKLFQIYLEKHNAESNTKENSTITFRFKTDWDSDYQVPEYQRYNYHEIDYAIQVLQINQRQTEIVDATLIVIPMIRRGFIVSHIILEKELYYPSHGFEFWLPLIGKPVDLEDGCIQLYHEDRTDVASVLVNIANTGIPFLDLSGTYHLKGHIIAAEVKTNRFIDQMREVTLFSYGGRITSYLDHATHQLHSVRCETTFYELEQISVLQ